MLGNIMQSSHAPFNVSIHGGNSAVHSRNVIVQAPLYLNRSFLGKSEPFSHILVENVTLTDADDYSILDISHNDVNVTSTPYPISYADPGFTDDLKLYIDDSSGPITEVQQETHPEYQQQPDLRKLQHSPLRGSQIATMEYTSVASPASYQQGYDIVYFRNGSHVILNNYSPGDAQWSYAKIPNYHSQYYPNNSQAGYLKIDGVRTTGYVHMLILKRINGIMFTYNSKRATKSRIAYEVFEQTDSGLLVRLAGPTHVSPDVTEFFMNPHGVEFEDGSLGVTYGSKSKGLYFRHIPLDGVIVDDPVNMVPEFGYAPRHRSYTTSIGEAGGSEPLLIYSLDGVTHAKTFDTTGAFTRALTLDPPMYRLNFGLVRSKMMTNGNRGFLWAGADHKLHYQEIKPDGEFATPTSIKMNSTRHEMYSVEFIEHANGNLWVFVSFGRPWTTTILEEYTNTGEYVKLHQRLSTEWGPMRHMSAEYSNGLIAFAGQEEPWNTHTVASQNSSGKRFLIHIEPTDQISRTQRGRARTGQALPKHHFDEYTYALDPTLSVPTNAMKMVWTQIRVDGWRDIQDESVSEVSFVLKSTDTRTSETIEETFILPIVD